MDPLAVSGRFVLPCNKVHSAVKPQTNLFRGSIQFHCQQSNSRTSLSANIPLHGYVLLLLHSRSFQTCCVSESFPLRCVGIVCHLTPREIVWMSRTTHARSHNMTHNMWHCVFRVCAHDYRVCQGCCFDRSQHNYIQEILAACWLTPHIKPSC